MYAIVQTGGKQYKVQTGDQVKVEKLTGEPGTAIELDRVLAVSTTEGINVGRPFIENAKVKAIIVRTARDRKIVVFKKKRRKGYHKKQGHRQWYTLLKIEGFEVSPTA
ncbi:MAG: 50S ribosomal protein L21 [Desulfomonile tiedjei]|nr:50S ribosomal protein L21 [Desulfomonile tiedjei]